MRIVKQAAPYYNETMKKFAYAKINLTLEIVDKRKDGLHDIKSVFQKISLHDTVEVLPSDKFEIHFTGIFVPQGSSTVHKAANLFFEKTGKERKIRINVTKKIPIQSGLGGGSSDAAAVLVLLNKIYGSPLPKKELFRIAGQIGADVPFFLNGSAALVSGTGEKIIPLKPGVKNLYVLLVIPGFGYSTKTAYELFDRYGAISEKGKTELLAECIENGCEDTEKFLYNDFEELFTKIDKKFRKFLKNVEQTSHTKFHLTGSGSAIFNLCKNKKRAENIFSALKKEGFSVFSTKTK